MSDRDRLAALLHDNNIGASWGEEPGHEECERVADRLLAAGVTLAAPSLVYADRNLAVQAFAECMVELGYPVAWGIDPAEPDWPVIYIETPHGQVSWHIPQAERIYEPPIRPGHKRLKWDGHTDAEKVTRLRAALTEGSSE